MCALFLKSEGFERFQVAQVHVQLSSAKGFQK